MKVHSLCKSLRKTSFNRQELSFRLLIRNRATVEAWVYVWRDTGPDFCRETTVGPWEAFT